jgi:hypothetical protein
MYNLWLIIRYYSYFIAQRVFYWVFRFAGNARWSLRTGSRNRQKRPSCDRICFPHGDPSGPRSRDAPWRPPTTFIHRVREICRHRRSGSERKRHWPSYRKWMLRGHFPPTIAATLPPEVATFFHYQRTSHLRSPTKRTKFLPPCTLAQSPSPPRSSPSCYAIARAHPLVFFFLYFSLIFYTRTRVHTYVDENRVIVSGSFCYCLLRNNRHCRHCSSSASRTRITGSYTIGSRLSLSSSSLRIIDTNVHQSTQTHTYTALRSGH